MMIWKNRKTGLAKTLKAVSLCGARDGRGAAATGGVSAKGGDS